MRSKKDRIKVLIVASETLVAALLGLLLELDDYEPVFAEPGERPEDALRRLRPPLIVVLDGALDAARSDLFYARAAKHHAHVVLFDPLLPALDVTALARARGVPCFRMPPHRAALVRTLEDALASGR